MIHIAYYTIPRKIRELQSDSHCYSHLEIIPYQEKLGNYNSLDQQTQDILIIPYQEKLGNYNTASKNECPKSIIPYQEKLGNYNIANSRDTKSELYHTKKN